MLDLIERIAARGRHGPGRVLVAGGGPHRAARGTSRLGNRRHEPGLRAPRAAAATSEAAELVRDRPAGAGSTTTRRRPSWAGPAATPSSSWSRPACCCATAARRTASLLIPPTVQAMVASRLDGLPFEHRDLARRLSVYQYDFDLEEVGRRRGRWRPRAPRADRRRDHRARGERRVLAPSGGSGTRSCATSRTRACPSASGNASHTVIAERLRGAGALTWAADHLEAAALAALDLDPADREPPDRAADALVAAGDRARRRMESRSAIDLYSRALAIGRPRGPLGRARGARPRGDRRGALLARRVRRRPTEALERAIQLGTELDDDWTLAHRASLPR